MNFSTENGIHSYVAFGQYSGEIIEKDDKVFLVVTDGIYLYALISDKQTKNQLLHMLYE